MNLTTRNQQRQIIRQQIRQLRQSLSPAEQNLAEQK
ncbi:5-formyltetrahydrofolate cyclo-ligase, partial [Avibacterium endocarditidis]